MKEKDTTKICSLENIHGNNLKMELHPDLVIQDENETKEKIIIRQNGDGDDD